MELILILTPTLQSQEAQTDEDLQKKYAEQAYIRAQADFDLNVVRCIFINLLKNLHDKKLG